MRALKNLGKWQNYVHYLLLTGGVFITHWLSGVWGIEQGAVNGTFINWIGLFLFYALGLFVFDTLVHLMFYTLPKPYRWRD